MLVFGGINRFSFSVLLPNDEKPHGNYETFEWKYGKSHSAHIFN
jgi:hypothetical protein